MDAWMSVRASVHPPVCPFRYLVSVLRETLWPWNVKLHTNVAHNPKWCPYGFGHVDQRSS